VEKTVHDSAVLVEVFLVAEKIWRKNQEKCRSRFRDTGTYFWSHNELRFRLRKRNFATACCPNFAKNIFCFLSHRACKFGTIHMIFCWDRGYWRQCMVFGTTKQYPTLMMRCISLHQKIFFIWTYLNIWKTFFGVLQKVHDFAWWKYWVCTMFSTQKICTNMRFWPFELRMNAKNLKIQLHAYKIDFEAQNYRSLYLGSRQKLWHTKNNFSYAVNNTQHIHIQNYTHTQLYTTHTHSPHELHKAYIIHTLNFNVTCFFS